MSVYIRQAFFTLPIVGLVGLASPQGTGAFDDSAKYRETYAIVDARIEVGNGTVIEKGTIVVKNGRIAEVGANVKAPSYAYVIKGAGMTVYPGFIDAFSTQGLKLPEWAPRQDAPISEASMPAVSMGQANRKGVRPDLIAWKYLNAQPQTFLEQRKAGFTTALIAPTGGFLNGSASLVNLTGRPSREAVLVPSFGMVVGFDAQSQGYPYSEIGAMAHIRQTLLDSMYAANPANGPAVPKSDPALDALQPMLKGQVPALMDGNESYEVTRLFRLSKEFNLKPILVGGSDAGKRVAEIKAAGVPVILTMKWQSEPNPKKVEEKSDPKKKEPPKGQPPKTQPEKKEDDPTDPPKEALEDQESKWMERVNTAKALAAAGVPFAFSARGTTCADLIKNVRRVITEGLPRNAALAALTISPARIFGVDRDLGTIEVGKLANLVVMNGDFAKENTKVTQMLIDGRLFKPETDRAPSPPGGFFPQEIKEEGGY